MQTKKILGVSAGMAALGAGTGVALARGAGVGAATGARASQARLDDGSHDVRVDAANGNVLAGNTDD
jgi:hypothetical protein